MLKRLFIIQPSLRACRELVHAVGQLMQLYSRDEQALYEIRLALTEAMSNIVLHALTGKNKGRIRLRLQLYSTGLLRFVLIDQGQPLKSPGLQPRLASAHEESGRGLYLISSLMDGFIYRHFRRQNILILDKRLSRSLKWKD